MSKKSEVRWGHFNYGMLCGMSYRRRDAWREIRELTDWSSDKAMRKAFSVRKVTVTWEEDKP